MKIRTIVTILAAAAFVSCDRETALPAMTGDRVDMQLDIAVPQSVAQSRSAIGIGQPDGQLTRYSLCVIPDSAKHEQWYHEFLGYDNLSGSCSWTTRAIDGTYTLSSKSFTPRGGSSMSRLGLYTSKGSVTLYGIHPYMANFDTMISDLDHIPFTVGKTPAANIDYMYIEPQWVDMSEFNPGEAPTKTLAFNHVMTAVEIRLSTTLEGTVQVDSVVLDGFDGNDPAALFGMSGTFSARNGAVAVDGSSFIDHLPINFNSSTINNINATYSYQKYTPYAFIFPAVAHADARRIRATIYFKYMIDPGLDLVGTGGTMEFEFDNIKTEGENSGLVAGYRYIYTATIDNFIKYSGYPEVEQWVVDDQIKDIIL
jgi:hypothetical protein